MKTLVTVVLPVVISAASTSLASAQTVSRFAVGVNFSTQHAPDDSSVASGGHTVGPQWRVGHSKEGWGWQYGLHWYSIDLDRMIGNGPPRWKTESAPLDGGCGYTACSMAAGWRSLATWWRATPSARSISIRWPTPPIKPDSVRARSRRSSQHPGGCAGLRLADVNKKVGVLINAGYVFARPQVKVTSTLGTDIHRVQADTYMLKIGLVYSVF